MRLRSVLGMCFLGLLLSSCFAKKKRTYGGGASEKASGYSSVKRDTDKNNSSSPESFVFHSAQDYINTFAPIAIEEMEKYGIPASITLAQGLLESGAGQSNLVKKSNNHFGIKCHTSWRGPSTTHDDDKKGECFRKYLHPRESYRDHSLFLVNGRRYAFLFEYSIKDYKSWAKGLKKAGYATDPKYPDKLIAQIKTYNLDRFDTPKGAKKWSRKLSNMEFNTPTESKGNARVHRVQKGDTLYSISKKYGLSISVLKKLNGLSNNNIKIGDELVLGSK